MNELATIREREEIESRPILEGFEGGWRAVEASGVGPRMRLALRAIATGVARDYREAAQLVSYKSHTDIYRYACLYGLSPTSKHLIVDCRRVAKLGLGLVEQRMLEDPDSVSSRDAVVAAGIAIDKVAKHERWGREDDGAGSNKTLEALDRIAEVLKGRNLELEISVRPSDPQPAEMGQVLEGDYESR